MKARELLNIGFKEGPIIGQILKACDLAKAHGSSAVEIRETVTKLCSSPESFNEDEIWKDVALEWKFVLHPHSQTVYKFENKEFPIWGKDNIEEGAIDQMANAMRLPITSAGALMPDAHSGYGLPIGGVLATEGVVIPYAVGVDIACRMMMTVTPIPAAEFKKYSDDFVAAIGLATCFGKGQSFDVRKEHPVLDKDWGFCKIVASVKDLAWEQLGTSGSGNHFVDIGIIEFKRDFRSFKAGDQYVAVLSHSGSRGPGNKIATHFSKLAQTFHPKLPPDYKHLAWLEIDRPEGQEYWASMELMGEFASANHHLIHEGILDAMGLPALLQVENHHNFAWKEIHDGREVIVHRKGATPASIGTLGVIPGSMASPGFLVEGKGNVSSLHSASHGAGRAMSRKKTKESNRWSQVRGTLDKMGIQLLSAGLDEAPNGYKSITKVMAAQDDLVTIVAQFDPRIVKMSDEDESED